MKKSKRFFALILTLAFAFGLTMPAFGANADKNDPLAHILPDLDIFGIDVGSLSVLSNGTGEEITAPPVPTPNSSRTELSRSLAFASDYTTLYNAITNSTASTIVVTANITMTDCIEISRDVTLVSGTSGTVTLTSASGKRHFEIEENNLDISFNDVALDGNNTGGGIEILHAHVTINGADIQNCSNGMGGAVAAFNQFFSNSVMSNVGSLSISNSNFESNSSETMGGAIASFGPTLISGSTLSENYADESGGAVYMLNLSNTIPVLTVSRTTIDENEADNYGGGIFVVGSTVNVSNSHVTNNTASAGGGMYSFVSTTTLNSSEVAYNSISSTNTAPVTEDLGGAGIHASGKLVLNAANVNGNQASMPVGRGAGILMVDDALLSFGGLNYNYNGIEEINVINSSVSGNTNSYLINDVETTNFYGGGIAALGVSLTFNNASSCTKYLSYNEAYYGGGIYSTDTVNITNGIIKNNAATYGGGIYSTGTVNVTDGTIQSNTATSGGGIYSTGIVYVTGGTICENAANYGGGIYSTNVLNISGGVIEYNIANLGGAGIYGKYVTFNENGTGLVQYNTTVLNNNNIPTGCGGGVYVDNGSFIMRSGYICYNAADVSAGGVYLYNIISFDIPDYSRIYGNTPDDLAFGY